MDFLLSQNEIVTSITLWNCFVLPPVFRYSHEDDNPLKSKVIKYIKSDYLDSFDDIAEVDFTAIEGKLNLKQHVKAERSTKLIRKFKKTLVDWKCSICSFDFEEQYGSIGSEFIEAHHTKPVSSLKAGESVSIKDLIAVCSNCHRMLHKKHPPYEAKELRKMIRSKKRS